MATPLHSEGDFKGYLGICLISIIVILAPIWLWVIKEPMAYQPPDYPMYMATMKLIQDSSPERLVILGDSRAMADIIPSRLGPGVVNLSLGGATPIEVYYVGRQILAKSPHPKAIVMYISPADFIKPDWFWYRSVEFGLLNSKDLGEIRKRSRMLKDDVLFGPKSPGDIEARMKEFLFEIEFPSYLFPALVNSRFYKRYDINLKMLNLVLSGRGHGYFGLNHGSTELDREQGLKSFDPPPLLDDYFNQTLALFQSQNIPVYFVYVPHNSASVRLYYPGLKPAFENYLNRYARQYPNFHVLGNALEGWPSEYFGDAWHLNEKGAPLFSDGLVKVLNGAHVEGGPYGNN